MSYSDKLRESIEAALGNMLSEAASIQDIHAKYYSDIPDKDFNAIIQADPTWKSDKPDKMGKFGKWILNLYKKNLVKVEDLYKVKEDLTLFVKYYNRIEDKDINHYQDTHSLASAVEPFREAQDKGEEMATSNSDEVRKAKAGAKKVYEDGQWLVLNPTTKEAAIYYGKNTRWCTAATSSNNMFDQYNDEGPLYIIIDKAKNVKYQFHFESGQYMDEKDKQLAEPVLRTIGMSQETAQAIFKGDSILLTDDGNSSYMRICDGCYLKSMRWLIKYDGQDTPKTIFQNNGQNMDAVWLGGGLVYIITQEYTLVMDIVSEQIVGKNVLKHVMPYGDRSGHRTFMCKYKDSLCVCQVTDENKIKVITNFRTTALPDTLEGASYYEATLPRFMIYNSGVSDTRTGRRAFNVYDMKECKMVLQDVVYTKTGDDEEYDKWICRDGEWFIGLRTAVNGYGEGTGNSKYYCVFGNGEIREDGTDVSESRKTNVNEYLDKETGTPLLRAARENDMDDARVVKDCWAVHFTEPEIALDIVKTGFRNGLSGKDLNKNTMTVSSNGKHVENGGYFYAYDAEDLEDADSSLLNVLSNGHAVMFRVNGVKYHNEIDDDDQIMFADNAVRDKILLYHWDGSVAKGGNGNALVEDDTLWGVGCVNGSPLFHSTLGNVIKWVVKNFNQYRKQLVGNTEIPKYGEYHEKSEEEYYSLNDLLPDNASNKHERWHSQEEKIADEKQHEELFSDAEYKKFCQSKGVDLDDIASEARRRIKSMNLSDEISEEILNNVMEFMLAEKGADWESFITHQEKEHPFYDRHRPDGQYWKWH